MSKLYYENELTHYGVLGMKWGVRKDPRKHYAKAKNKSYTLKAKADKAKMKAAKNQIKLDKLKRKLDRVDDEDVTKKEKIQNKIDKIDKKVDKLTSKSAKYANKARSWIDAMDEVFGSIDYDSISQVDIDRGEEYTNYIMALQSRQAMEDNLRATQQYLDRTR